MKAMNIYRFTRSISLTAVLAVVVSVIVATNSTVSTVSAQVAADNNQKQLDSLLSNITKEVDRRQTVLDNSTGNTGTTSAATGTSTTNANTKDCGDDVPKAVTDGANKDASKASSDLKSLEDSLKTSKTLTDAQSKAKQTDDSHQSFQLAAAKSAVVGDLCTQANSKDQLEQLLAQAKEKLASQESSGGSSSGGSSSGGSSDSGNTEEQIKMLEQLIVAIAAIIASVVALIMALLNQDYAAAIAIFQTILGQLTVVASVIVQAIASVLEIDVSLSGTS